MRVGAPSCNSVGERTGEHTPRSRRHRARRSPAVRTGSPPPTWLAGEPDGSACRRVHGAAEQQQGGDENAATPVRRTRSSVRSVARDGRQSESARLGPAGRRRARVASRPRSAWAATTGSPASASSASCPSASASTCCSTRARSSSTACSPTTWIRRSADRGSLAADGVVTGIGAIDGRRVAVIAYDFTVMAGSMGQVGEQKTARMRELVLAPAHPDRVAARLRRRAHPVDVGLDVRRRGRAVPRAGHAVRRRAAGRRACSATARPAPRTSPR